MRVGNVCLQFMQLSYKPISYLVNQSTYVLLLGYASMKACNLSAYI